MDNIANIFIFIFLTVSAIYLYACYYLHKREKVIFFYSYSDIAITMINPVIGIILLLLSGEYLNQKLAIDLFLVSCLIVSVLIWFITYRANNGNVIITMFLFFAKILLGLLLLSILVITWLISQGKTQRKKYEREKTYEIRMSLRSKAIMAAGVGLFYVVLSRCCYVEDFSFPEKIN